MKVHGYYNTATKTALASRATLRVEFNPTRPELVELLAAAAPSFDNDLGEGWVNWNAGEQAADLPKAQTLTLIVQELRRHGEETELWHEDIDPRELAGRRDWATRHINRHWGRDFAVADAATREVTK